MPTFLRVLIGAIAGIGLLASPLVVVLTGHPDDTGLIVETLALVALWFGPLFAGLLVSSWSTSDDDSRRRVRRVIVVCALVTIAGAGVFVAVAARSGGALWAVVLVAVLALALFPVSIAMGAAARRIEERRLGPKVAADEELAAVDGDLRLARKRSLIGAAIGTGIGLGALILIAVSPGGRDDEVPGVLVLVLACALLGVVYARIGVQLRLTRRTRELLGSDYGAARRAGRIIRGKGEPESTEEAERAARYARIAIRSLPFQTWSSLITIAAVVLLQVPGALDDGIDPVRWFIFGGFALVVVGVVPVQAVQLRRIRAYAAAHPLPVAA